MTPKLSVVIDTYNKEIDLPRCIKSITEIADEILVCDQESTDNTVDVAKKYGARVVFHKKEQYVELVRNFEIGNAIGDWVLILDPDEEVPQSLARHIKNLVEQSAADYYRIPRKNVVFGKWLEHSRWWPDLNIRLFKKGCVTWNEAIHSVPIAQGVGVDLENKEEFAIIHHHYDSVEQYVDRMNRYTTQQANNKINQNYKFEWHNLISKPVDEFLSRYFMGEGYKDGIHGLAVSLLQSFSELVLYLKIWQAEKFKEDKIEISEVLKQMSGKEKDLHYWTNDALYKETGSTIARIKRKLQM